MPEPYPTDSLGRINRWTLDSMRRFYYWNEQIPAKPDHSLSPELFFQSLLSPSDRFSHISGPHVPAATNSYFTFGFHYAFLQAPGYDHYIGVVTFVNINGAADRAGLARGSYFIKVNGRPIDAQHLAAINREMNEKGSLTLTTTTFHNDVWEPGADIQLNPGYARENSVYYTRIYNNGATKTGYLYYTSFDESFDGSLLEAFRKFRDAGVSELILDLRYNAGGSVASSAKLAALIARQLNAGEVYAIYEGNRTEGRRPRTLQAVLNTSGSAAGRQYSDLQPYQLSINRLFVLTTHATVSAAELVVNNLKPFLNLVQIGETTAGKDEASFTITDQRSPREVEWTLQPIVYKLFNKNGEGGYSAGITPQHAVSEMSALPLGAIGAGDDALTGKALEIIYGPGFSGLPADLRRAPHRRISVKPVYQSVTGQAARAAPVSVVLN
ncbi:peptidase S41 [Chitinophaga cymbidii]|uniref:Peptidase S41 n=1 Tax=Chitinophaga cymbidii TaxID=1096750 RepID=A0A512REY2_9BACT|nr:peptidase S41 [Chitinophaga cymbidii]